MGCEHVQKLRAVGWVFGLGPSRSKDFEFRCARCEPAESEKRWTAFDERFAEVCGTLFALRKVDTLVGKQFACRVLPSASQLAFESPEVTVGE